MGVEPVGGAAGRGPHVRVRHPLQDVLVQRVKMPVGPSAAAHRVENVPVFHIVAGTDHAVETDQAVIVDRLGAGQRVRPPRVPEVGVHQTVVMPQLVADHSQAGALRPHPAASHRSQAAKVEPGHRHETRDVKVVVLLEVTGLPGPLVGVVHQRPRPVQRIIELRLRQGQQWRDRRNQRRLVE